LGERIDTGPYPGAYTMRAAAELADGTLLLPVTDIPEWTRIYLLRSRDDGATWLVGPLLADDLDRQFSEPCIVEVAGTLVVLIREERTGFIHQCVSVDGGVTWSAPAATPMWGCPPHVLLLTDGRLLCTYGHRRPPFGIRACFSTDAGQTWDQAREVILRDDLPTADLGYPSTLEVSPGHFFTTCYAADAAEVSGIEGIFWNAPSEE
jgi:sialidase-1